MIAQPSQPLEYYLATDPALAELLQIDAALVRIGRKIRVLKTIAWPKAVEIDFWRRWKSGRVALPVVELQKPDLRAECEALDALMRRCDRGHPIGNWLYKTAWSYRVAAQMLMHMGEPEFTRCSSLLYGRPDTRYSTQDVTNAQLAQNFLNFSDELIGGYQIPPAQATIPAEQFAQQVREKIAGFFQHDSVEVIVDAHLSSKATAGSKRISIRESALFSELDLEQLVHHEAFVHTATSLNGRHQPFLQSLSLAAPRTTRAQEGLATFAEIITDAIDISRLRRLALRVDKVQEALDGADFIDVFRGFLAAGQSEAESYMSAARIFRGGDVHGSVCYTKDAAYLEGVLRVYTFLRKALQENQPQLTTMIFAGRMTVADAVELEPYFANGFIAAPVYLPPWAQDPRRLLAALAFFTMASHVRIDTLTLQTFVDTEEDMVDTSGVGE